MAHSRARRFRAGRYGREARRRGLSAELARVFHLARSCAISDTRRYRPHSGLHVVNPELGVVFDYLEPSEAFSEELRQLERERAEQNWMFSLHDVSALATGFSVALAKALVESAVAAVD